MVSKSDLANLRNSLCKNTNIYGSHLKKTIYLHDINNEFPYYIINIIKVERNGPGKAGPSSPLKGNKFCNLGNN